MTALLMDMVKDRVRSHLAGVVVVYLIFSSQVYSYLLSYRCSSRSVTLYGAAALVPLLLANASASSRAWLFLGAGLGAGYVAVAAAAARDCDPELASDYVLATLAVIGAAYFACRMLFCCAWPSAAPSGPLLGREALLRVPLRLKLGLSFTMSMAAAFAMFFLEVSVRAVRSLDDALADAAGDSSPDIVVNTLELVRAIFVAVSIGTVFATLTSFAWSLITLLRYMGYARLLVSQRFPGARLEAWPPLRGEGKGGEAREYSLRWVAELVLLVDRDDTDCARLEQFHPGYAVYLLPALVGTHALGMVAVTVFVGLAAFPFCWSSTRQVAAVYVATNGGVAAFHFLFFRTVVLRVLTNAQGVRHARWWAATDLLYGLTFGVASALFQSLARMLFSWMLMMLLTFNMDKPLLLRVYGLDAPYLAWWAMVRLRFEGEGEDADAGDEDGPPSEASSRLSVSATSVADGAAPQPVEV